jgi:hypothetical protein
MRGIKSLLGCGLVLAVAGCASKDGGQMTWQASTAMIRSVIGSAQWSIGGGAMRAATPNMILQEGATIQTGADSAVDMQVNGHTSTVRLTSNTTMTLSTMKALGGDSETVLDVRAGTILSSVRKLSKNSKYQVITARGVAGIRGTDFLVQVVLNANGPPTVTFTCVTGKMICIGTGIIISASPPSVTLTSGQSWSPPETAANLEDIGAVQVLPDVQELFENNRPGTRITVP